MVITKPVSLNSLLAMTSLVPAFFSTSGRDSLCVHGHNKTSVTKFSFSNDIISTSFFSHHNIAFHRRDIFSNFSSSWIMFIWSIQVKFHIDSLDTSDGVNLKVITIYSNYDIRGGTCQYFSFDHSNASGFQIVIKLVLRHKTIFSSIGSHFCQ